MKWYRMNLYRNKVTGKDVLGVETSEPEKIGTIMVRIAPYNAPHQEIEGNSFNMIERSFLTKATTYKLFEVTEFEVAEKRYRVTNICDLESGETIITGRRSKPCPSTSNSATETA